MVGICRKADNDNNDYNDNDKNDNYDDSNARMNSKTVTSSKWLENDK